MEITYKNTRIALSERQMSDPFKPYKCIEFHFCDCILNTPIADESYDEIIRAGKLTPATEIAYKGDILAKSKFDFITTCQPLRYGFDKAKEWREFIGARHPESRNQKTRPELRFYVY